MGDPPYIYIDRTREQQQLALIIVVLIAQVYQRGADSSALYLHHTTIYYCARTACLSLSLLSSRYTYGARAGDAAPLRQLVQAVPQQQVLSTDPAPSLVFKSDGGECVQLWRTNAPNGEGGPIPAGRQQCSLYSDPHRWRGDGAWMQLTI